MKPTAYPRALPSGTMVDTVLIKGVLGEGGFAITYDGEEQVQRDGVTSRERVALKELIPGQIAMRKPGTHEVVANTAHNEVNFEREIRNIEKEAGLLATLDHPGVVKLRRFLRANGTGYLVMDFIEGDHLDGMRKTCGPPDAEAFRFCFESLLNTLEYCHGKKVWHRDIHPGNVMMTRNGPVLIDFGCGRMQFQGSYSLEAAVCQGYSPFEKYSQSSANHGPWTDIYSLSATMISILTGRKPPEASLRDEGGPEAEFPWREMVSPDIDERFLDMLEWGFQVRRQDRPQSIEDWKSLRNKTMVVPLLPPSPPSPPPPPPQPDSSEVQPGPTASYGWMIGAGVAVSLLLFFLLSGKTGPDNTLPPPKPEAKSEAKSDNVIFVNPIPQLQGGSGGISQAEAVPAPTPDPAPPTLDPAPAPAPAPVPPVVVTPVPVDPTPVVPTPSTPPSSSRIYQPGDRHADHPNVVYRGGNVWRPAPGYHWVDPNAKDDLSVLPIPATPEGIAKFVSFYVQAGNDTEDGYAGEGYFAFPLDRFFGNTNVSRDDWKRLHGYFLAENRSREYEVAGPILWENRGSVSSWSASPPVIVGRNSWTVCVPIHYYVTKSDGERVEAITFSTLEVVKSGERLAIKRAFTAGGGTLVRNGVGQTFANPIRKRIGTVSDYHLNLRVEPTEALGVASVIERVPQGEVIETWDIGMSNWCLARRSNGSIGFISSLKLYVY